MKKQRIVKFVTGIEVTKEDWGGFMAKHPTLQLVATADTEAEVLDKMDRMIVRSVEFAVTHGNPWAMFPKPKSEPRKNVGR